MAAEEGKGSYGHMLSLRIKTSDITRFPTVRTRWDFRNDSAGRVFMSSILHLFVHSSSIRSTFFKLNISAFNRL